MKGKRGIFMTASNTSDRALRVEVVEVNTRFSFYLFFQTKKRDKGKSAYYLHHLHPDRSRRR